MTGRSSPRLAAAAAALAALAAGGCTAQGPFPSLAPRAAEREPIDPPPRAPAPDVADDPALGREVSALLAQARRGDAAFDAAHAAAAGAVAAAGAQGTDSWVAAQESISRAEAARADSTRALAELDRIALDRAARPTSASDSAALTAAMAETERLVGAQQARIDRLRQAVSRR